jgi:hypothetical protein
VGRAGCANDDASDAAFRVGNFAKDAPAFVVDATAGLGGLCYLVGSTYFLSQYDTNTGVTHMAAAWFVSCGLFFFVYFFTTLWSASATATATASASASA